MVHLGKFILSPYIFCNSLVAQTVKNLPAMQETRVQSLGGGDPLEKGMATHPYYCLKKSIDRGTWRAPVQEPQRVGHD